MNWEKAFPESSPLKVEFTYKSGTEEQSVLADKGVKLPKAQNRNAPKLSWNADPNKRYLVVNIDPDAPCKAWPILGEVVHWMVSNIQGEDMSSGDVIAPFGPPGPPPLTGAHRYVFFVYEQPSPIDRLEIQERFASIRNRTRFRLQDFAKKYGIGEPIAQNWFTCGFS